MLILAEYSLCTPFKAVFPMRSFHELLFLKLLHHVTPRLICHDFRFTTNLQR